MPFASVPRFNAALYRRPEPSVSRGLLTLLGLGESKSGLKAWLEVCSELQGPGKD